MSSSLLYDVISKYEPDNLLLKQAHQEVLERQFEATRLLEQMKRVREATPRFINTEKIFPHLHFLWCLKDRPRSSVLKRSLKDLSA